MALTLINAGSCGWARVGRVKEEVFRRGGVGTNCGSCSTNYRHDLRHVRQRNSKHEKDCH